MMLFLRMNGWIKVLTTFNIVMNHSSNITYAVISLIDLTRLTKDLLFRFFEGLCKGCKVQAFQVIIFHNNFRHGQTALFIVIVILLIAFLDRHVNELQVT